MKHFVFKLSIFAVIIVVCDVVIGRTMDYVVKNIEVGGRGRDNYICDKSVDDILIFGSSRAVHHYNSSMIEDSLGMSCYNCGDDGNGIILSYGRLSMIKERHQPKIVIHDVNPEFDVEVNDNSRYLGWLRSRYNRHEIATIFNDVDKKEKYKMLSGMYCNNSVFLQNLFTFFTGISNSAGIKGYRPLTGEMDEMMKKEEREKSYSVDKLKVRYIKKFIEKSKGAKLYFVVSPIWYGMDSSNFSLIKEICDSMGVEFIDFSNNKKYVHNDEFFRDGAHLNEKGANEFTKDLIATIQNFITTQN